MSGNGWIKVHRSLLDHWIFEQEPLSTLGAWIDLLLMVNYKPGKFCIGNKLIDVQRGSTITSIVKLASRWRRGRKWVSRFLDNLEKDEIISQKRDNRFTVITICNYSKFQREIEEDDDNRDSTRTTRGTAEGTTPGQQTTHNAS